ARLEPEGLRLGLRHRLHLSLSVWRSRPRRRPQLHLEPDLQGLAVQQRRRLFEPRDRSAVRRRRYRLPRLQARGGLSQGAEDPDRRRAGGLAARAPVPDHYPLQRQEPRYDRDRRQRRLPRRLARQVTTYPAAAPSSAAVSAVSSNATTSPMLSF